MGDLRGWASCGAMALTGDADGPPLLVPTAAARVVDAALAPFGLDAGVLGERAALLGLRRNGRTSCGGGTRLLEAADGWIALTLARTDDVEALPALLDVPSAAIPSGGTGPDAPWATVAGLVRDRSAPDLVDRAAILGLPLGRVGEAVAPFRTECRGPGARTGAAPPPHIVDLTSLWAGPLATACLARAGARVVKVEDRNRPDGARRGDRRFFALLDEGKDHLQIDLASPAGRRQLHDLVAGADIVVTSGRARAIAHLGLDPDAFIAGGSDRVWVAITGHGWASDRVGFGDDAAAAAGLVAWHSDGRPRFAGDAIADPLTGALAAAAARRAWNAGGRWFVDASLAGAAAAVRPDGPARPATRDARGWTTDGRSVAAPSVRAGRWVAA